LAKITILIVDHTTILKDLLAIALRALGYNVLTATTGAEALKIARESRPNLVILEPAVADDGLRFLRALRADPPLTAMPVVILTAIADRKCVLETARLGVQAYMLKGRTSGADLLAKIAAVAAIRAKDHSSNATRTMSASQGAPPALPNPSAITSPVPHVGRVPSNGKPTPLLTREQSLARAEQALQAKTLSGEVAQVIAMAASPRTDLAHLAESIARDLVLSTKVLQAANSAAYASKRGMITSIPEAVRHIGCATIRNIAATVGVFEAMPATGADGFNPIRCWQHSFAVARLCERLAAGQFADQTGTAYLAGLCHDLGDILFRTHFAPEYAQVLEMHRVSLLPLEQLERDMLGVTHQELSMTILRCLALPDAIRSPIEEAHAACEPRQPLARILRLADGYATGLLLAASAGASLAPLSRAECRKATGEDCPSTPSSDTFRGEILALTSMLARLDDDGRHLLEPLCSRQKAKIWLSREAGLSSFDPIGAALEALGEVRVSDRLPVVAEIGDCGGLVVLARSPSAVGLDATAIQQALAGSMTNRRPVPVLWLAGRTVPQPPEPVPSVFPRSWPISISELAAFVESCGANQVRPAGIAA
jgi:HD-like signal output (HDOD) protein/DNA-binding NarL/FixJ family response regulator